MAIDTERSYEITPRHADHGGGWKLVLLEDGEEAGGGVFPIAEEGPEVGMSQKRRKASRLTAPRGASRRRASCGLPPPTLLCALAPAAKDQPPLAGRHPRGEI